MFMKLVKLSGLHIEVAAGMLIEEADQIAEEVRTRVSA